MRRRAISLIVPSLLAALVSMTTAAASALVPRVALRVTAAPRAASVEHLRGTAVAAAPLSADVEERLDAAPRAPSTTATVASSPTPTSIVAGIDGHAPSPDTQGAVGAGHLLEVAGAALRISTKTGDPLAETTLLEWWQAFDLSVTEVDDTAVAWEPFGVRFVMAARVERASGAALALAVSQTADPTGTWWTTRVDVDAGDAIDVTSTRLGYATGWITVAADRVELADGDAAGSLVLGFDRAEAEDGDADMTYVRVVDRGRRGVAPVATADPWVSSQLLISDDGDGRSLTVGQVAGTAASAVYEPEVATVSGARWSVAPVDAPQLGSATQIDMGDARLQTCSIRNGSVWCVHTVFLPAASPNRASVQWWQFLPDGTVLQQGRIDDPDPTDGTVSTSFPSLAVNGAGAALVGYSRFSADGYASGGYRFRSSADSVATTGDEVVFAPGDAPYVVPDGNDASPWGATSATVVDPSDGSLWSLQTSAATPGVDGDRWRTTWARVTPPPTTGADVAVVLSRAPTGVLVGRVAEMDLVAVPNGPGSPEEVTLHLDTPSGAKVVSAPSLCAHRKGGVDCPIGHLDLGETARLAVGVRIDTRGGVPIEASVTSADDPNPSDDVDAVVIQGLDATTCTAKGTAGDDQLFGTPGTDVLCGRGGDDVIYPGGGEDLVIGGSGYDYVAYADVATRVSVDLGASRAIVAGDRTDLLELEGAFGGPRADKLIGGRGDDVLTGLGGDDRIDGGPGDDTVSYYSCVGAGCADLPVVVSLFTGSGRGPGVGADVLRRIERVYGSLRGDDRLLGDDAPNALYGFGGDDQLYGYGGDDVLSGGDGADRLDGGAGNDFLSGGAGADVCRGGTGTTTTESCP